MITSREGFSGTDEQNRPLWCSQPLCGLERLVQAGAPQGESYPEDGASYALSMYINKGDLQEILSQDRTY